MLIIDRARPLSCPGSDLTGVKLLQRYEDAKDIHASCLGHKAVVVGTSFIGCHVFSSYVLTKYTHVFFVFVFDTFLISTPLIHPCIFNRTC